MFFRKFNTLSACSLDYTKECFICLKLAQKLGFASATFPSEFFIVNIDSSSSDLNKSNDALFYMFDNIVLLIQCDVEECAEFQ